MPAFEYRAVNASGAITNGTVDAGGRRDAMRMIEAIVGWRAPVYQVHNMGETNPEPAI